eukprot:g2117.t1
MAAETGPPRRKPKRGSVAFTMGLAPHKANVNSVISAQGLQAAKARWKLVGTAVKNRGFSTKKGRNFAIHFAMNKMVVQKQENKENRYADALRRGNLYGLNPRASGVPRVSVKAGTNHEARSRARAAEGRSRRHGKGRRSLSAPATRRKSSDGHVNLGIVDSTMIDTRFLLNNAAEDRRDARVPPRKGDRGSANRPSSAATARVAGGGVGRRGGTWQ